MKHDRGLQQPTGGLEMHQAVVPDALDADFQRFVERELAAFNGHDGWSVLSA